MTSQKGPSLMRFDLDEPIIPADHARHGLVSLTVIAPLEERWKAAKIDEWCAVAGLNSAAARLRAVLALPVEAPIQFVLTEADRKRAADPRVRRALTAYEDAATIHERVRVHLTDLRNRATIPA